MSERLFTVMVNENGSIQEPSLSTFANANKLAVVTTDHEGMSALNVTQLNVYAPNTNEYGMISYYDGSLHTHLLQADTIYAGYTGIDGVSIYDTVGEYFKLQFSNYFGEPGYW